MRQFIVAAAAMALAAGTAASAADLVIKYDDLDLSSAAGQKALNQRIEASARAYCGADALQTGTRSKPRHLAKCMADVRSIAAEQIAEVTRKKAAGKSG